MCVQVCRSSQDHEETVLALLFSILTDNSGASKVVRMTLLCRLIYDWFVVVLYAHHGN